MTAQEIADRFAAAVKRYREMREGDELWRVRVEDEMRRFLSTQATPRTLSPFPPSRKDTAAPDKGE